MGVPKMTGRLSALVGAAEDDSHNVATRAPAWQWLLAGSPSAVRRCTHAQMVSPADTSRLLTDTHEADGLAVAERQRWAITGPPLYICKHAMQLKQLVCVTTECAEFWLRPP